MDKRENGDIMHVFFFCKHIHCFIQWFFLAICEITTLSSLSSEGIRDVCKTKWGIHITEF